MSLSPPWRRFVSERRKSRFARRHRGRTVGRDGKVFFFLFSFCCFVFSLSCFSSMTRRQTLTTERRGCSKPKLKRRGGDGWMNWWNDRLVCVFGLLFVG